MITKTVYIKYQRFSDIYQVTDYNLFGFILIYRCKVLMK